MLSPIAKILIVDDESTSMYALCNTLSAVGYQTTGCISGIEALNLMQKEQFDLLLTDLVIPQFDGVTLLTEALKIDPLIVGILMTGHGTIETAVEAMKVGALDYVLKPIKLATILPIFSRAVDVRRLRLENMELRNTVAIHELNQAIANTLDPNVLLDKITNAALAQFDADETSIMLLTEGANTLYVAAVCGKLQSVSLGDQLPIGNGIAGKAAETREAILIDDEAPDPDSTTTPHCALRRSFLSMPMITRSKLIGVLNVSRTRRQHPITFGQIKIFSVFTNAAAAGIEAARLHDEQRRSDTRYREILDMAADSIISTDESQKIIVFNHAAEILFGHTSNEVIGQPVDILLTKHIANSHRSQMQSFGNNPKSSLIISARDRQVKGRRKDGSLFDAEVEISKHTEHDTLIFTAIVRDITQRNQQAEKIVRLTRIQQVLSGINSAIVRIHDQEMLLKEACRIAKAHGGFEIACIAMINAERTEIVSTVCDGVTAGSSITTERWTVSGRSGGERELFLRAIQTGQRQYSNNLATEPAQDNVFMREAIHMGFQSAIVLPLMLEGQTTGLMTLFAKQPGFFDEEELLLLDNMASDISFALDHMAKNEKLNYLAFYDALTRLPNRALFTDRLELWVNTAKRERKELLVGVLNLERFRNVNEALGRRVGDELLRQVGRRLKEALLESDMVARLGADQFSIVVWLHERDENINLVLERVMSATFNRPYEARGSSLRLSARAGIAIFPADGDDAESLYRNAESALRTSMKAGVPYLQYTPQMNAMASHALLLETRLHRAIEQKQFVLYYQPKVHLDTGDIHGFEALIRWNDPEAGLIPPGKFIPLLEETGLICEVGHWAISQALNDRTAWFAMGLDPPCVSVNVSAIQIRQKDFVDVILNILGKHGKDSHGLSLEITESIIMEDIEDNISKLRALADINVSIHIDDFGTGYSSLSYLTKLPVSTLKIDQSFVATMNNSTESMAVVSTIISLAHSLRLNVVAEGVETQEQANLLKESKCDEAQGYLFGRPAPFHDIVNLLGVLKGKQ